MVGAAISAVLSLLRPAPREQDRRLRPPHEPVRQLYTAYALAILAAAAGSLIFAGAHADWGAGESAMFWLLAACLVAAEVLAGRRSRTGSERPFAPSSAFAFSLLLSFGAAPAMVAGAVGSLARGPHSRALPLGRAADASRYVLSIAAAASALSLLGEAVPVAGVGQALPEIMAAATAWLVAGGLLSGIGEALSGSPRRSVRLPSKLFARGWPDALLLALAPLLVVSARESLALIPIGFLPVLALVLTRRQAAANEYRALHDPLTDLPNRSLLLQRLDAALEEARRDRLSVFLLMLDIDDFKAVNDALGHRCGDLLIQGIAARVGSVTRHRDTLARLGGDEFAVLMEAVSGTAEADAMAQRILAALERPFEVDALALEARASIGIASYPEHGLAAEELLQHADMALYRAKESEIAYQPSGPDRVGSGPDRRPLAAELRRGIDRGDLVLDYQPKVVVGCGRPVGVEALVRWNHPRLGIIAPGSFIRLAEQTGLIQPLTERVLEAALAQCARWRRAGLPLRMSVNLSTRSLLDGGLAGSIEARLRDHQLPPFALQLEIRECRVGTELRRAAGQLEELRRLGVGIAIDDFGTGVSSLTQLQDLPVEEIKIDKSLVAGCRTSRDDRAIVRSSIRLGRDLGIRVTAEGVETEAVYRDLDELGCDFAQGFFLAPPVRAARCRRELERLARTSGVDSRESASVRRRAASAG